MTIQEQIQQEAHTFALRTLGDFQDYHTSEIAEESFTKGATFGYSLAEKEMERLERAIRKMDADFIIAEKKWVDDFNSLNATLTSELLTKDKEISELKNKLELVKTIIPDEPKPERWILMSNDASVYNTKEEAESILISGWVKDSHTVVKLADDE